MMDRIVTLLRAAGEPTRLRLLLLLSQGELTVSEFVQILGQSQPRVSRHLKLLAEAGLVERLPEGSWAFYRLAELEGASGVAMHAVLAAGLEDADFQRDTERLADVKRARSETAAAYFAHVAEDWDRIRALHMEETAVEAALLEAAGQGPFDALVDVGVGSGRVLQLFAPRIDRGLGVDLSHDMLTVARAALDRGEYRHCSVRHGDLYALPLPRNTADIVTIHQVLHYLDAPGRAIAEAARILRPGGRLLIVDFAPHTLEFLRDEHAHRRLGFADEEVSRWMEAAGLLAGAPITLSPTLPQSAAQQGLIVKIWTADACAAEGSVATPIGHHLKGDAA